MPALLDIAFTN